MATFTVTNTNNSGAGSLRQGIVDANALSGKDIINFGGLFNDGLAHTISLTASGLSITDDLIIQGTNPNLLTIKDNSATRVFDIASGVTAAINGLTVTNSYKGTAEGGAISNEGVLTLSNTTITGNTVTNKRTTNYGDIFYEGYGGGIYNTGSLTVNYSNITGNTASYSGGGIYSTGSLTVDHSTITGNKAEEGGGIFSIGSIDNASNLILNYSTITDNTAVNDGGGILAYDTMTTVSHSLISRNTTNRGGGIEFFPGDSISVNLLVNNSTISDNTSTGFGGGIYIELVYETSNTPVRSIILNNSAITGNTAEQGGGIGVQGDSGPRASITLNNSAITGNTASSSGGGIMTDTNLIVSHSIVNHNYATYQGGGIEYYGNQSSGTLTVTNSQINDNSVGTGEGGGIYNADRDDFGYLPYGNSATITVSNSTISRNTAAYGGGIYNYGTSIVTNSIITDNNASSGGGIYNNGILSVSHSTISHNYATEYGGGIYNYSSGGIGHDPTVTYNQVGHVSVNYSRLSDNQAHFGGGIYNDGILTVDNSIINHNRAFGTELSSGQKESGEGGGIYNDSIYGGTTTLDYSTIVCNFDTPQEDSTKFIKVDNFVGKFIKKGSSVRV